jgi:hypothetical protein
VRRLGAAPPRRRERREGFSARRRWPADDPSAAGRRPRLRDDRGRDDGGVAASGYCEPRDAFPRASSSRLISRRSSLRAGARQRARASTTVPESGLHAIDPASRCRLRREPQRQRHRGDPCCSIASRGAPAISAARERDFLPRRCPDPSPSRVEILRLLASLSAHSATSSRSYAL